MNCSWKHRADSWCKVMFNENIEINNFDQEVVLNLNENKATNSNVKTITDEITMDEDITPEIIIQENKTENTPTPEENITVIIEELENKETHQNIESEPEPEPKPEPEPEPNPETEIETKPDPEPNLT